MLLQQRNVEKANLLTKIKTNNEGVSISVKR
jgi:hypothetical protein